MTRDEFNSFWLPELNELARRRGIQGFVAAELDGLWHHYCVHRDEDEGARAPVAASVDGGPSPWEDR